jgi:hypothetical protein
MKRAAFKLAPADHDPVVVDGARLAEEGAGEHADTTISVTIAPGETAGGDGVTAMPHDGAT